MVIVCKVLLEGYLLSAHFDEMESNINIFCVNMILEATNTFLKCLVEICNGVE